MDGRTEGQFACMQESVEMMEMQHDTNDGSLSGLESQGRAASMPRLNAQGQVGSPLENHQPLAVFLVQWFMIESTP